MTGLIVHEWIERTGGAEKVLDQFAAAFPSAKIRCLWDDTNGQRFPSQNVTESWMSRTLLRRHKALALPFMLASWRNLRLEDPDWILVSSHLFAHHVSSRSRHSAPQKIVYVHTPARYIWTPELDARGSNLAARAATPILKSIDRRRSNEADLLIANSEYVRSRVRRFWDQDADVIHPPVDTELIRSYLDWREGISPEELAIIDGLPETFLLGASRFVPYKRLDLVISAAEKVGLPAVIAGSGPLLPRLREQAEQSSIPVTFIDEPSTPMLYALYQMAAVYIFPPVEDFGIMPVEAMALGTRCVVNREGGTYESLSKLNGGSTFESEDASEIASAIQAALDAPAPDTEKAHLLFSNSRFRAEIQVSVTGATL